MQATHASTKHALQNTSEQSATEKLRILELFVASFTHEVKNQIGAIHSACKFLDRPDKQTLYANIVREGIDDAYRLIENMLSTVKVNAGTLNITLQNEPFCFVNWLPAFLLPFQANPLFPTRIEADCCIGLDGLIITADKVKLGQILLNLLINAQKHAYRNTSINIKCNGDGKYVIIQTSNKGHTIPAEQLSKLFTPYFMLTNGHAGNGLGLHISKTYIEAMGGTITAKSANELTTFMIKIPIRPISNK
ncbi:sensor histidine kinase [Filimonas effusa]|uniref:histidine kinase n=1 Tax=Filimonas effusa TaxID=2508721 RepID=A0A4Q1D0L0_9BACT|nr:HAMP domain-containing sensor histidine kinase [Filimonas effusa]RXK81269.1 HAMP domain-containing histidine kinase [Filimonas effusa]